MPISELTATVPSAPMPTHVAYAPPTGRPWSRALDSSHVLTVVGFIETTTMLSVNDAVSAVRCDCPLDAGWKMRIDEDYQKREQRGRR